MKGSGIEETLEQVYGPNAVTHMMSGKAITRAPHGLFLIEAALSTKILSNLLPHDGERNTITDTTVDEICSEELSGSNNEALEVDEHPTFLNHSQVIALKKILLVMFSIKTFHLINWLNLKSSPVLAISRNM